MIDAYFRPLYQQCFVKPLHKWSKDSDPNTITSFACFVGILIVPALYVGLKLLAILLLGFSSYLDSLASGEATAKGIVSHQVIDIISSRVVECAVVIGLYGMDPVNRGIFALAMLSSCYIYMTCYLVMALFSPEEEGARVQYSPKLIERTEILLFFAAMMLFPSYFFQLSFIFTILLLATSASYIYEYTKFKYNN